MKRSRINPVSKKRRAQNTRYTALRKAFLADHPLCSRCGGRATEIHHRAGRIGEMLNNTKWFMATCRACHDWIENNRGAAQQLGFIVRIYRPEMEPENIPMVRMLTEEEAAELNAKIHTEIKGGYQRFDAAAAYIKQYKEQEGWKAQGYKTFQNYFEAELEAIYGSRRTFYRLLKQQEVQENIEKGWAGEEPPPPVSQQSANVLSSLSEEEQAASWEEITKEHGPKPSPEKVEEHVQKKAPWKGLKSPKQAPLKKAKIDLKHEYAIIAKSIGAGGKEFVKAIEDGILDVPPASVKALADEEPGTIVAIAKLVGENRWSVQKAKSFLSQMPDEKWTVARLADLALAQGGTFTGTFGPIEVTIKRRIK